MRRNRRSGETGVHLREKHSGCSGGDSGVKETGEEGVSGDTHERSVSTRAMEMSNQEVTRDVAQSSDNRRPCPYFQ